MANIDEYIKQIQQAQYREEVRGSIVNALKKVNDDNNSYVAIKKEVVAAKDIVEEKANAAKETLTALQASTQIANEAKSSLNNIISSAISTKKELEQAVLETGEVIARVDNAKSNLDKSITSAGKAELNLQRQIETSNQIKNQLDVSNNTAIELKKNLDVAINEANTAKVKLVEAINNAGNAALEKIETAQSVATRAVETAKVEAVKAITTAGTTETEKVTAEGTKQVGLVKTEGEKQVQAVQTAAQEIITDRKQIQKNTTEIGALKEEIPSKLSELQEDGMHRTVTDAEKENWNAKSDFSGNYNDLENKPAIPTVPDALPNPHALTFSGAITAEYDGSGAVMVTIPDAQTERIEKLPADTIVELQPNKLYIFPEMASLTYTLASAEKKHAAEYHFVFKSGTVPTEIVHPKGISVGNFSVNANKIYEVSVMENLLTSQNWEVAV